ncbi:hypothetical protein [Bradyrhizobium diazoefficiens]
MKVITDPVWFDHRLDPATLAELGAIEAEHRREIARGLGVDRRDERRILRRSDAPALRQWQTGALGNPGFETYTCAPCDRSDGDAEQSFDEIIRGVMAPDRPPRFVKIVVHAGGATPAEPDAVRLAVPAEAGRDRACQHGRGGDQSADKQSTERSAFHVRIPISTRSLG